MMEFNSLFANALVEAHQEELRKARDLRLPKSEGRPIRKAMGNFLIRLGERLGGTPPGPAQPAVSNKLAMP